MFKLHNYMPKAKLDGKTRKPNVKLYTPVSFSILRL